MQWAHIHSWTLHCLAASLKAKDTDSNSQRMDNHSTYYHLKTILVLCYAVPLGHSAVLPITQYINTGAAESNTISNKSQPTRGKSNKSHCSVLFIFNLEEGISSKFLKHIFVSQNMQKQSQSTALTSIRLVEAHNVLSHRGELFHHKQCSRAVLAPGGTTGW